MQANAVFACVCVQGCVGRRKQRESLPPAASAPLILINPSNNPPDIGCPVFVGGLVGESEEGVGGVNPSHPNAPRWGRHFRGWRQRMKS